MAFRGSLLSKSVISLRCEQLSRVLLSIWDDFGGSFEPDIATVFWRTRACKKCTQIYYRILFIQNPNLKEILNNIPCTYYAFSGFYSINNDKSNITSHAVKFIFYSFTGSFNLF